MEKIGKVENKKKCQALGVNVNICKSIGKQMHKSHTPLKNYKLCFPIKPYLLTLTFRMRLSDAVWLSGECGFYPQIEFINMPFHLSVYSR